jgi:hypothetical protein
VRIRVTLGGVQDAIEVAVLDRVVVDEHQAADVGAP